MTVLPIEVALPVHPADRTLLHCCLLPINMAIQDYLPETEEERADSPFETTAALRGGTVAGFVATAATLVPILLLDSAMLSDTIAGMYGLEGSLLVGLVAHLVHGTLFGLAFAFVLSDPGLTGITRWWWKILLAGIVYGLVLSIVATGFVLPVWLEPLGASTVPEVPFVTTPLVAWHVLYGVLLGALFPFFERM